MRNPAEIVCSWRIGFLGRHLQRERQSAVVAARLITHVALGNLVCLPAIRTTRVNVRHLAA